MAIDNHTLDSLKARVAAQGFKLIRTADKLDGFPYAIFDPVTDTLVQDPLTLEGVADVLAELEARQREDDAAEARESLGRVARFAQRELAAHEPETGGEHEQSLAKRAIAMRVEIEKLIHRSSKDAPIDKATADALYILADGNGKTDLRTLLDDKGFYEGVDYSYIDDEPAAAVRRAADRVRKVGRASRCHRGRRRCARRAARRDGARGRPD